MKKVHFPYKEPRIDQRFFQAEIPPLKGRAPNRAVTRGSLSSRAGEETVELCSLRFTVMLGGPTLNITGTVMIYRRL